MRFALAALVPLALASLALAGCGAQGRPIPLVVGAPTLEQNALLYVALDRGLFARQGLSVTIRDFDTGPAAIAALMGGSVDVAETAEFPFVSSVRGGRERLILAANDRFENDYLVARRDRGVSSPGDLRGKRIGVSRRTIAEFFLDRFLELNGVPRGSVTLVDVPPGRFVSSLQGGAVDALVAWQPFVSRIVRGSPESYAQWPVQSGQAVYGLLVCGRAWLERHVPAATRLLASLAAAEDFVDRNAGESRAVVARRLGYDERYLSDVWDKHGFSLTLEASLVTAMEGEARWLQAGGAASRDAGGMDVPDFTGLIWSEGLRQARPEGINLMQ